AGAWWDTYLLLGEDMPLTLQLFADAFPGLQAATFNGNEGPAFRDVLVDVLQADDDDGDITNGTPHGAEIVEAFAIHGITLLSNVTFSHTPVETAASEETIDISANVNITFPTSTFLSGVRAFYRLNNSTIWSSVLMTNTSGSTGAASIPAQPTGTVIGYYLALEDINGQTSSVDPIGAAQEDPNLPHFILVGMELQKTEDADMVHQLGTWTAGQPTDNATTGLWEQNVPVGSFGTPGDPSTMVQPNYQHTPGGDFCWVTGNATNESAALGENDVDGGTTTLISGNIDLTAYENPVFTYWRWYTNNPPSGANPNADWWQVYISGNGGSTWVPVEDTKSSDRSWRRNAFRVSDYVTPSAAVRLKFHASDSIRPGQNLDGGSLIEAAVDDIQLWELEENTIGIDELANAVDLNVHPDPANDRLNVIYSMGDRRPLRMEVLDLTGRTVLVPAMIAGAQRQVIDVGTLTNGQYVLRLHWADGAASRRFNVLH
ncbi:MAG: T9SS type A sorting domain-containing protein, partial [Flavobacteriales bacterium]|nr:T9SS type A sorting domain-containing protein [Flavobacteriales bacterium]